MSAAPPYDGYLADHRERLNAQVAGLMHRSRRTTHDDIRALMQGVLAPIYDALVDDDQARAAATMQRIDEVAFDLLGRGLLGASANESVPRRSVREAWAVLVPAVPHLLHDAPRNVCVAITHAVLQLSETLSDRHARAWTNRMLAAADVLQSRETAGPPPSEAWLLTGQVAAWRSGMAHFRNGALDILQTLPPALSACALSLRASEIDLAALRANPFANMTGDAARPLRIGGFSGYLSTGSDARPGLFDAPPLLAYADDQLYAVDGAQAYRVFVDAFGHAFRRTARHPSTTDVVTTPHGVFRVSAHTHFIEVTPAAESAPAPARGR